MNKVCRSISNGQISNKFIVRSGRSAHVPLGHCLRYQASFYITALMYMFMAANHRQLIRRIYGMPHGIWAEQAAARETG